MADRVFKYYANTRKDTFKYYVVHIHLMPDFETLVEHGDYALVRVDYGKRQYIYTAKRTSEGRWMKSGISESRFREMVKEYLAGETDD